MAGWRDRVFSFECQDLRSVPSFVSDHLRRGLAERVADEGPKGGPALEPDLKRTISSSDFQSDRGTTLPFSLLSDHGTDYVEHSRHP